MHQLFWFMRVLYTCIQPLLHVSTVVDLQSPVISMCLCALLLRIPTSDVEDTFVRQLYVCGPVHCLKCLKTENHSNCLCIQRRHTHVATTFAQYTFWHILFVWMDSSRSSPIDAQDFASCCRIVESLFLLFLIIHAHVYNSISWKTLLMNSIVVWQRVGEVLSTLFLSLPWNVLFLFIWMRDEELMKVQLFRLQSVEKEWTWSFLGFFVRRPIYWANKTKLWVWAQCIFLFIFQNTKIVDRNKIRHY